MLSASCLPGHVAWDHGCLIEDNHVTARASYSIDPKGILRGVKTNDLYVGSVVKEAPRSPVHHE